ncbi:uncharacterized protein [Epargyreus clarus]|uniref:uncharacterized protein n=1 Tax=Epargyreus clarus TaxID=520877 RepID=UPI003C2C6C61
MEQIVLKTEVQPNGDILLFYVDESKNGESEDTAMETAEQSDQFLQNDAVVMQEDKYVIEEIDETEDVHKDDLDAAPDEMEKWLDEETKKLLIFYTDNKEAFLSGTTKRKHLWDVACRTMLHGKNHVSCEQKLKSLMKKYSEVVAEKRKGIHAIWPYLTLCHHAFYDNDYAKTLIKEQIDEATKVTINVPNISQTNSDGILVVKKVSNRTNIDEKVETMLNLYLKHRKSFQKNESQRGLWELIVCEMGEQDVDYWHRRFLNFKQHYIRMLHKQKDSGAQSIIWPYMKIFNQIFQNDEEFHQKFSPKVETVSKIDDKLIVETVDKNSWIDMEKTFLVKYYFDCFQDFQDPSIPTMFLWNEIGRLLDKKPDDCKEKFNELKDAHVEELMKGAYNVAERLPIDIVLDNVIAKETQLKLEKGQKQTDQYIAWKTEQVDELVQYFYDNTEMLKDPICYYVAWFVLSKKSNKSCLACLKQWENLTALYKSILNDKKENPDMLIDWRYIELFDRIFDYGMAVDLLDGSEKLKEHTQAQTGKIGVKKITIKDDDSNSIENGTDDEETYDERGFVKRSKKQTGDTKAFKILEFYLKHKHKFSSPQYKRVALWETLSKQIGVPASECAHRFRNFKQVYKAYVKREISKPEKPILWPYYPLCKKVFGYRSIKAKLKNELKQVSDDEDWSAKDIKTLISFFAQNFQDLHDKIGDSSQWTQVAIELGRSNTACSDKFMELRKSYRKLKTMKTRNPDVKVSWKYFNFMDELYTSEGASNLYEDVQMISDENELLPENNIKEELNDEDYTIIFVSEGEGEDMQDISNAEYIDMSGDNIVEEYPQETGMLEEDSTIVKQEIQKPVLKWTKGSKKRLVILYLNYLRTHKGKEIKPKEMWMEIAGKFGDRKPITCKKMFLKLKERHKQAVAEDTANAKTPYFTLFEKILSIKPKFARIKNKSGEDRTYKDYPIDETKVELALKYYLQNIDEFISPKFEKKYLWTELANYISEPASKIFNKVNFLIQFYKSNTLEAENTRFGEILKEIFIKESLLNDVPIDNKAVDEEVEYTWSDDETEILLTWYLAHLEKFKNPKFVRSYLWMEASDILKKSPWACSNKMSEIRTQYRTMVKENPDGLNDWRFSTLCQRIYGTGKRNPTSAS